MQVHTYQEALDYLYSFLDTERNMPKRPAELNLPRTFALLRAFGEPQRSFPSVVIAGTKGKGSTASMLESIVRSSGLRTGLWSSPHLHSYRERIQVNRQLISQADLVAQVNAIQPQIAAFDTEQYGNPTVFELGFIIALRTFAERNVDLAIIEVGLGGRYDSANAITPLLSIITSISYDHMHILGNTLTQIASDKAGIFKPGVPAIVSAQHPEALAAIVQTANEVGTPLWVACAPNQQTLPEFPPNTQLPTLFDPFERYHGPTATALQGVFQHENARLATGAALLLRDQGLPITDQAIGEGLANAQWPGRMEVVPGTPTFVLDGAHNGDSAHKLLQSLREAYPGRKLVLVLGTSQDKDIARILNELVPAADALVLTRSWHPRAWVDLDALAERARPLLRTPETPLLTEADVPEAIAQARRLASPDALICVTGSLFVVAAAREILGLSNEKD
jgi:dihydrofolate synthase/folylpolyglutamate synthase